MMNKLLLLTGIFILFTSCDKITDERVWADFSPIQCESVPWLQDWFAIDRDDYSLSMEEHLVVFEKYFVDRDIKIHKVERVVIFEIVLCVCGYPSGDLYRCYINESDVGQMLEWGFIQE